MNDYVVVLKELIENGDHLGKLKLVIRNPEDLKTIMGFENLTIDECKKAIEKAGLIRSNWLIPCTEDLVSGYITLEEKDAMDLIIETTESDKWANTIKDIDTIEKFEKYKKGIIERMNRVLDTDSGYLFDELEELNTIEKNLKKKEEALKHHN